MSLKQPASWLALLQGSCGSPVGFNYKTLPSTELPSSLCPFFSMYFYKLRGSYLLCGWPVGWLTVVSKAGHHIEGHHEYDRHPMRSNGKLLNFWGFVFWLLLFCLIVFTLICLSCACMYMYRSQSTLIKISSSLSSCRSQGLVASALTGWAILQTQNTISKHMSISWSQFTISVLK